MERRLVKLAITSFSLMFMASLVEAKGKTCFIHPRVQEVAVKVCSVQRIKIPNCVGACPTTESLYINDIDVSRIAPGSNSACSCCRPVEFKEVTKKVQCFKMFVKTIKLKIPVRCECDSNCSKSTGVDRRRQKKNRKTEIEKKRLFGHR